jgi:GTPase involved in cell partitioning and DNA repair
LDGDGDLAHAGRTGILDDSDASTVVTDDDPEVAIKDAEEDGDRRAKARGSYGGVGGHGSASTSQHPPARRSYGEYDPAIDGENGERGETQSR